ncbi:MAG: ATP-binding protein [Coprobacillaceae bacterium]
MDINSPRTLVIEDTGIGIQKEDLPRVFERGFTGYNGRMNKRSTGIGLYLCKKIITNLQHDISIESTIGVGTKVKINLEQSNIIFE